MRKTLIALLVAAISLVGVLTATAANTATKKLEARLRGAGPNRGQVEVRLNAATGKVCWEFKLAKIDGKPNQAHIHKGRRGVSGNVVVPFGASYKRQGCTTAAKATVKTVLKNPRSYYVNVHNAKHPAGAMRGQLNRGA
ncbi:MAG TPA: CHRD domain-containing protein [Gaiellaceae bacterium]|nr:CHRD domain-containing protein [Gaiellaceae bacterium]